MTLGATAWVVSLAVVAGVASWWMQRRRRRWRSLFDDVPIGMTRDQFELRQEFGFQTKRLLVSLLIAALAGVLGIAVSSWTLE